MNPKTKEELEEELHEKYRQLCEKEPGETSDNRFPGRSEKEQTESVLNRKENKD